jgi:hypothetical protein
MAQAVVATWLFGLLTYGLKTLRATGRASEEHRRAPGFTRWWTCGRPLAV